MMGIPYEHSEAAIIDRLEADNTRLRAALERIATYEVPGTRVYLASDAANYARQVLEQNDPKTGVGGQP